MPVIDQRTRLVLVAGTLVIVGIGGMMVNRFYRNPSFLPPCDFLQFWSTGRVLLWGGDPYDSHQLLTAQIAAGRSEDWAIVMWYPPHALGLSLIFGAFAPRTSQLLWLTATVALAIWSADRIWRLYEGPIRYRPIVWLAALGSFPLMHLLFMGQTGSWVLFGLTGLLVACVSGRSSWAVLGAFAAFKPHLSAPLVVVLLLSGATTRAGVRILAWGAAGLLGLLVLVLSFDPAIFAHYHDALTRPEDGTRVPLSGWVPPLIAYRIRVLIDPNAFWIQFMPVTAAALGTVVYWWVRSDRWDWCTEFPRLVLLGIIASPYGAWEHDQIVLLIPVLAAGAGLARSGTRNQLLFAFVVLVLINGVAMLERRSERFIWVPPAIAIWCFAVNTVSRRSSLQSNPEYVR